MSRKMTEVISPVKTFVIDKRRTLAAMAAGNRVREERVNRGWTEDTLAKALTRAGYPISQSGVHRLEERDVKRPKCTRELCAIFGITENWLITGRGEKHLPPLDLEIERLVSDLRRLSVKDQEMIIAGARAQVDAALKNQTHRNGDGNDKPRQKLAS
jgi:transcriptional regulator with XRE-family HTH domain